MIVRENAGLDFGSWAAGFAKHESKITGRLLLANDSVYGPIGDLRAAFDRLISVKADFYGFVQSADISTHVQSWFLLFENDVVRSSVFKNLMSQSFETMGKAEIIKYGEVGLTSTLLAAGMTCRALYELKQTPALMRCFSFNPMHFLWYEMLVYEGVPFIKVELVRDNPVAIHDVDLVEAAVSASDPEIWKLMLGHQKRIGGLTNGRPLIPKLPTLSSRGLYRRVLLQKLAKQTYHSKRDGRHLTQFAASTGAITIIWFDRLRSAIRRMRLRQ